MINCRAYAPRSNPTRAILNFFSLKIEETFKRQRNFMYEKCIVLRQPLRGKCQFGGWKQVTTPEVNLVESL